jgi:Caspase domain
MDGQRSALIVANDQYSDPGLQRLRAPAQDAEALANVLGDPAIGNFAVKVLANEPEYRLRREISAFFAGRVRDDLLLVHFSCHGVKDASGQLYFATADTELADLDATAVPADFVNRHMTRSGSRRVVLLLDCCYSGAFARGLMARSDHRIDLSERFEGRGRIVLTASSAMEYAFEDTELAREAASPSVFTKAVVEGLRTGDADRDGDGRISVDELYDYVYDEVRRATPNQTPGRWNFEVQGGLLVARSPSLRPAKLAPELQQAIEHSLAGVRLGAVAELEGLLRGSHAGLVLAAKAALERLGNDDSQRVSAAASAALAAVTTAPGPPTVVAPATTVVKAPRTTDAAMPTGAAPRLELSTSELDFGILTIGQESPTRTVRVRLPAGEQGDVTVTTAQPWIRVRELRGALSVSVDTSRPGRLDGQVVAAGVGGRVVLPIKARVRARPVVPEQPAAVDSQAPIPGPAPPGVRWPRRRTTLAATAVLVLALTLIGSASMLSGRSRSVAVGVRFQATAPSRLQVTGRHCSVALQASAGPSRTGYGTNYSLQLRQSGEFFVQELTPGCRAEVLTGPGGAAHLPFVVYQDADGAGGDSSSFESPGSFQVTTSGSDCRTTVYDALDGSYVSQFDGSDTTVVDRTGEFYVSTDSRCTTTVAGG